MLAWPQQQSLSSWEMLLPWHKPGHVSAGKGAVPCTLPARAWDSPWCCRGTLRDKTLGTCGARLWDSCWDDLSVWEGVSLPPCGPWPRAAAGAAVQPLLSAMNAAGCSCCWELGAGSWELCPDLLRVPCAGGTLLRGPAGPCGSNPKCLSRARVSAQRAEPLLLGHAAPGHQPCLALLGAEVSQVSP